MLPRFGFAHSINVTRLLMQVRDLLARVEKEHVTAEDALNKITQLTAQEMAADVSACYILRPGEVLELFAAYGFRLDAIHHTRLRLGEGMVGTVGANLQIINTDDVAAQPDFAYRPETGEDNLHSFLGVPILRGGKLRGVLTIQNKRKRLYQTQDIEILQTIALLIAELIAGGRLLEASETITPGDPNLQQARLLGTSLNGGLAIGHAVLHKTQNFARNVVADDKDAELSRLDDAVEKLHQSLDSLILQVYSQKNKSSEQADILETYRMFASDRGWLNKIRTKITQNNLTAEAAVHAVQDETSAKMAQVADPYLKSRISDFEDLTHRLLMHLAGYEGRVSTINLPENSILVARTLGPADFLEYNQKRIKAILLEEGSASSHVAIMARALGVPVIGQCQNITNIIEPLDQLIVDGDSATIFVRPSEDVLDVYEKKLSDTASLHDLKRASSALPAVTQDGVDIDIMINSGLLDDIPDLHTLNLAGVGLYRTEIPFIMQEEWPSIETQTEWYEKAIRQANGKPVIFRTLDIGSDKKLPYMPWTKEENPALGWRGVRVGLDRPAIMSGQIRAILNAIGNQTLYIMFPMVSDLGEYRTVRTILNTELKKATTQPRGIKIGVMMEVPSLLWQMPELLKEIDFLSVGSNDLLQYLYAIDRTNPSVAARFDPLSPAFLRVLKLIADECRNYNVSFSLCGEMAGRPLDALVLLGLGYRALSMSSHAVGPIKNLIRGLNLSGFSRYLEDLMIRFPALPSYRGMLKSYARDHGLNLES